MKVCFELIQTNSGSDVWTYNLVEALSAIGIETHINKYPNIYQYFPDLIKFIRKKSDADIIHTNSWSGFAFKDSRPMVVTEHHVVHDQSLEPYKTFPQELFHKLIYSYEKRSFSIANRVTCISDYTKDKVKTYFNVDSARIYNGINTNFFKPQEKSKNLPGIEENKINLLFAGNMLKRKGVDLLPFIINKLDTKCKLICASGLRKGIKEVSKNIHITGRLSREELLNYYNACNIFLFPTRLEGFGLTVAEAMACGKPVVTTNCSSMPELIIDGKGGFLCEMDNITEFANKILILSENEKLRKGMGIFNRKHVEDNFSLEKMAKGYIKIYEELLA